MACSHIKLQDGTTVIVKHSPARYGLCKFCKHRFRWDGRTHRATLLCDFEIGKTLGGEPITCDAKVCVKCAKHVGPDKHWCPKHSRKTDFPPVMPEPAEIKRLLAEAKGESPK